MKHFSTQSVLGKTTFLFTLLLTAYPGLSHGDIISKLFNGYDKALRPDFENNKPTIVQCTLTVESFGNIEEANMEYMVYTYFHQYWVDTRLAGKLNRTITIKGDDIENIWVPDPYCYNARESNMMMPDEETHSNVKIKPNGEIEYSRGVTLLASCIMDLKDFPLDSQECTLKFGSYGHNMEDIIFMWKSGETEVPVGHTQMAQFEYKGSKLSSDIDYFASGNFSTMTVTFSFERRIGYYLIQVYFPDIFVVILSWIVFWMDKDDMGNRMTLGITSILTIMFLLGSLNGNLPKVSYPKALDWYLLVSFSFVFLTLIECTIVFLFESSAKEDEEKIKFKKHDVPLMTRISSSIKCVVGSKGDGRAPPDDTYNGVADNDLEMVYRASKENKAVVDDVSLHNSRTTKSKRKEKIADKIDKASRVLFPLAFVVYNCYYWIYYSN
ncbi:gamma-aminobutyric acid receptor subunit beta-3-like isoform X2 [Oculina patagonica]